MKKITGSFIHWINRHDLPPNVINARDNPPPKEMGIAILWSGIIVISMNVKRLVSIPKWIGVGSGNFGTIQFHQTSRNK